MGDDQRAIRAEQFAAKVAKYPLLYEANGMQLHVDGLDCPAIMTGGANYPRLLVCGDTGHSQIPNALHLLGCGCLAKADHDESLAYMLRLIERVPIDGIASHARCVAGAQAAVNIGLPATAGDDLIKKFSTILALRSGAPYLGQYSRERLCRPDFQDALVIYYPDMFEFAPSLHPRMPRGLIITRHSVDPVVAQRGVRAAVEVVFGPYGFGEEFCPDTPLTLTPVVWQGQTGRRQILEAELGSIISQIPCASKRIRISSIELPRW